MMERVIRRCGRLAVGLLVAVSIVAGVAGTVFVIGMRGKSPRVQGAVRRMNKAVWNPRTMDTAGSPGAYASVVHHVGRRSGSDYRTPVVPVPTEDGFVIALPYGPRADWVQNVLAAGAARITHEGATYEVERPTVVPTELVEGFFGESERRSHRAFRIDECLRVYRPDAMPE